MNIETKKIRSSLRKLYKIYINNNNTWGALIVLALLDKSLKKDFTKEQVKELKTIIKVKI